MIQTKNLKKIYTTEDVETTALNQVNLAVQPGETAPRGAPRPGCGPARLRPAGRGLR